MSERWAPSSAIRERARQVHPSKPEPTIDDVLWYLDVAAADWRKFGDEVRAAFKKVADALSGRRRKREGG